jgi:hypothetical protein
VASVVVPIPAPAISRSQVEPAQDLQARDGYGLCRTQVRGIGILNIALESFQCGGKVEGRSVAPTAY